VTVARKMAYLCESNLWISFCQGPSWVSCGGSNVGCRDAEREVPMYEDEREGESGWAMAEIRDG